MDIVFYEFFMSLEGLVIKNYRSFL